MMSSMLCYIVPPSGARPSEGEIRGSAGDLGRLLPKAGSTSTCLE